ncbi:F-box/LRR-repeat protein 4-like [Rhododendron vialii]|uniref:F-box/LRR-repeat protein 4-like n=1 Tax=Rhododendron vialii TaxID=182163 RepID=UPI00265E418F|nr:F-box/LRR-repeat protein 4-like [Rhododendron vialii]
MDGGLCDELLEEVLRRLPRRGTFFASSTADVSLVSKRWLRLYRSTRSTLSLRLSPDDYPSVPTGSASSALLRISTSLFSPYPKDSNPSMLRARGTLTLNRCEGIGNDTSSSLFVKCLKGLQEVELIHCRYEILSKLVNNCASLSSLLVHDSFAGTKGLRQFITHGRCNLRKLDLRTRHGLLRETDLLAVGEKFRGLLSLRLHGFSSITGEGLKTMMLAMSNELEELALVNCNLGPGLLTTLGQKFRNLRKLDLSSNTRMLVDKEFISMLASCNFLTVLKVRSCRGLTNASLVSMFQSCKQLESVDIMDCPGIEAEYVEFFVLNCPRLRQIRVEESKLSDVSRSWASKKLVELVFH